MQKKNKKAVYESYVKKRKMEKQNLKDLTRSATFFPSKKGIEEDLFYKKLTKAFDPESKFIANKVMIKKFQELEEEHEKEKKHEEKLLVVREYMQKEHVKLAEKKEKTDKLKKEREETYKEERDNIKKRKEESLKKYLEEQKEKLKDFKKNLKETKKFKKDLKEKINEEKENEKKKQWGDYSIKHKKKIVIILILNFFNLILFILKCELVF